MSTMTFLVKASVFASTAMLLVKLFGYIYIFLALFFGFLLLNSILDIFYFIRNIYTVFLLRWNGVKRGVLDISTSKFWVLPTDIDFLGHMNNSRYLRESDFARAKLYYGAGILPNCLEHVQGIVVGAITIRYRRSLELFQFVHINSRIIYWDEKAFYVENQFVTSDGFIAAVSFTKQVLVQRKKDDPVTPHQLIVKIFGEEIARPEPARDLLHWIEYNSASSETLRPATRQ